MGGTGSVGYPAARAAASSLYTGSVSPIAFAKKRNRPFSISAVTAGNVLPM